MINNQGRFVKGMTPWNKNKKGWLKHTKESKEKISKTHRGKKFTDEHKEKLRQTNLGKNNPFWKGGLPKCVICKKQLGDRRSKYCQSCVQLNEKHFFWKGDDASYQAKHQWVYKRLGKPSYCEVCKTTDKRKSYHWSNKNHKYLRNLSDWQRVCALCHKRYDKENNLNGTIQNKRGA